MARTPLRSPTTDAAVPPAFVPPQQSLVARTGYQDFLALWKDADPDVPILTQAKAEYTKLH
jgi:hypothetical protein